MVDQFEKMINCSLAHFSAQFAAGIYWGSFNNNYTLDGRFLDLEVPLFLTMPTIGKLHLGEGYAYIGGTELVRIIEDY